MTMMLARAARRTRPVRSSFVIERISNPASIPNNHVTLAAMIDRFDHNAIAIGNRTFLPNDAITWVALRHMRGSIKHQNPYVENLGACYAKATLAYGIPSLAFAWNSADCLHPFRMKYLNWYFTHRIKPAFDEQQLREWRALLKMRSHWRFAQKMGMVAAINKLLSPADECEDTRVDLTAGSQCLPRPFLAYAWTDVAVLKRSAGTSSRSAIDASLLPMGTVALVPAESVVSLASRIPPLALWWDVTACSAYLDCTLETMVFPRFTSIWPRF